MYEYIAKPLPSIVAPNRKNIIPESPVLRLPLLLIMLTADSFEVIAVIIGRKLNRMCARMHGSKFLDRMYKKPNTRPAKKAGIACQGLKCTNPKSRDVIITPLMFPYLQESP